MKANKNLGQHFLCNKGVIEKITLETKSRARGRPVVEVGPGMGALTQSLLKENLQLLVCELDPRMCRHLEEEFADEMAAGQLLLLEGDLLKQDIQSIEEALGHKEYCLCGNLPYNRGTEILFYFLEKSALVQAGCVMLQKEVVRRLIAQRGGGKDFSSLSIKFSLLAESFQCFNVSPGSFKPAPKVDSAVLSFDKAKNPKIEILSQEYNQFKRFVDHAFTSRRKILKNKLPWLPEPYSKMRAEELTVDDFLNLYKKRPQ